MFPVKSPSRSLKLSLAVCAAGLCLGAGPARADLASNLKHTPAQVDSFVSLSTSYEDWRYFLTRKPFAGMFAQLRKDIAPDLEKQLGMSFERDLAPMLGTHLNVAVYDEALKSQELLPFLLVFDLKDTAGFPKLIARLKDVDAKDASKQLLISEHQGVTVYGFSSSKRSEGVPYMALSGHTLLIGSKTLVTKAIDAGQGRQAAALSDGALKVAYDSLGKQKLWAYLNPASMPQFLSLAGAAKLSPAERAELEASRKDMVEALSLYDSLGFGLDLNPKGLVLKSVVRLKTQGVAPEKQALMKNYLKLWSDPKAPLKRVLQGSPSKPLFFASINGLQLMQQSMKVFGPKDAEGAKLMQALAEGFKETTQLDYEKDVQPFSDGRGGVSVFYPEDMKVFDRPPQMVFFLGVKNAAGFQQRLSGKLKLNLAGFGPKGDGKQPAAPEYVTFPAKSNANYQGYALYIAEENATVTKLRQSMFMQPAYAQVGDLWLLASSPDSLRAGIDHLSGKRASLLGNAYFNQLKDRFGMQVNGGLMYMDLSSLIKLAEFLGGEDEEIKALKPTLNAFKSILAGGRTQGNVAEGVMVVDIDMDSVNFELLGQVLKSHASGVSDPTRGKTPAKTPAKPQTQPQSRTRVQPRQPAAQPSRVPPKNPNRHQGGL